MISLCFISRCIPSWGAQGVKCSYRYVSSLSLSLSLIRYKNKINLRQLTNDTKNWLGVVVMYWGGCTMAQGNVCGCACIHIVNKVNNAFFFFLLSSLSPRSFFHSTCRLQSTLCTPALGISSLRPRT